jgi:DNA mismatch repair protein MutL
MPIVALSSESTHVLRASQVLLTPSSAVKELVENALDACATSIIVEVSADVISMIKVRDNGHGIPPDDRVIAGNKHCTSKISSWEDVKSVKSLGFRGEALHALRTVTADHVKIETKVKGEVAGQAWFIGKFDES